MRLNVQEPELSIEQLPTTNNWSLTPLYAFNQDGLIETWQLKYHHYQQTLSLFLNQQLIEEISLKDQPIPAIQLARRLYLSKRQSGFQPAGPTTPNMISAMKSYPYKEGVIKHWPVALQVKVNGLRLLCQDIGQPDLLMKSSLNNQFTNLQFLQKELGQFLAYLPKYATLDGELAQADLSLNELRSLIKSQTLSLAQQSKLLSLKYQIYDVCYENSDLPAPFEKRATLLQQAYQRFVEDHGLPQSFELIPVQMAHHHQEVWTAYQQAVSAGYLGVIIKKISQGTNFEHKLYQESLYKAGRNNHSYKLYTKLNHENLE